MDRIAAYEAEDGVSNTSKGTTKLNSKLFEFNLYFSTYIMEAIIW